MLAGKYRIIRELGRGGEGTVYLAEHILTGAARAVKVSGWNREGRSIHELNMLRHVHHDALPRILDVFQEDGVVCLVMEYVEGKALSEYVNSGEVNETFFFRVAEQLLETLEYLHTGSMPMLHLDVKPSNILIHGDGRLTLLDLGAAMPVNSDKARIRSCFGTPGYAAPEQFGRLEELDERTDLYSFGATMFFLLTGKKYEKQRERKPSELTGKSRSFQKSGYLLRFSKKFGWKGRMLKLLSGCLEEEKEKRPDSAAAVRKKLLRIKRQRELERSCQQTGIAFLLLAGVLALAWREAGGLLAGDDKKNREYEKLIGQAELTGLVQAASLYRQAVFLCPDEIGPYQKLVERIGADCVFSLEEEQVLQSLMDAELPLGEEPVFNQLEETSDEFGKLAYDLGIIYWYFYEGSGGRAAASGWFAKAVQSEERGPEEEQSCWFREAGIYQKIGSYYEKLGKQEITGEAAADSAVYWRDLSQLCQIETGQGKEMETVRRNLMEERLNLLILESARLRESGIQKEELQAAIEEIEKEGGREIFPERCEEAAKAVERAFEEVMN